MREARRKEREGGRERGRENKRERWRHEVGEACALGRQGDIAETGNQGHVESWGQERG